MTTRMTNLCKFALGAAAVGLLWTMPHHARGNGNALSDPSVVTTRSGLVRGNIDASQRSFLGIPYAAPPIGEHRWKPPLAHETWDSVRDATTFASACAQPITDANGKPAVLGSEDCLYLNVYAPTAGSLLPVLVFVHGGAYRNGAGSDYDATALSRKGDVVVVTVNYRLGAFGFLAHPALSAESFDNASGQYGLLDQRVALKWIWSNITAFGGDPRNVTLAGQSSGAYSVCNHLASPFGALLFQKAIMQSGACSSTSASLPLAPAESAGIAFAKNVGCATGEVAGCLRAVAMSDLALAPVTERVGSSLGWAPATGGVSWPTSPADAVRAGQLRKIPVLMGTNHDEYRVFAALQELAQGAPISGAQYTGFVSGAFGGAAPVVLSVYPLSAFAAPDEAQSTLLTDLAFVCPARTTANLISANTPTYVYEFDDATAAEQVPGLFLDQKAYHGAELLYLFRQPMSAWGFGPIPPLDVNQQILADQMIKYWAAFVTTGNPNVVGLSPWPQYSSANSVVLRLTQGTLATTTTLGLDHQCGFWAGFGI